MDHSFETPVKITPHEDGIHCGECDSMDDWLPRFCVVFRTSMGQKTHLKSDGDEWRRCLACIEAERKRGVK